MMTLEHISLTVSAPPSKDSHFRSLIRNAFNVGSKKNLLEDINFSVKSGDKIALVGKNGAGKSTLCKILSGAIKPTEGRISYAEKAPTIRLLSMSSYLIGQMTGLENIYYMGAMLGIRKAQITEKEAEIIDFCELEKSINEQYETYSSGMKSRLRFAITTAFPADILILDEILSVGDKNFKNKARNRMNNLLESAKSIIMVNHSQHELKKFCTQAIYLDNGKIKQIGSLETVLKNYK